MNIFEQSFAVLSLMEKFGKVEGRTRLQKLVFLLDSNDKMEFGFKKSTYGPFSSRLCDIVENMAADNWVKERQFISDKEKKKFVYELQTQGLEQLKLIRRLFKNQPITEKINKWLKQIESMRLQDMELVELLRYVYKEYPAFAGDYFTKKD